MNFGSCRWICFSGIIIYKNKICFIVTKERFFVSCVEIILFSCYNKFVQKYYIGNGMGYMFCAFNYMSAKG